MEKQMVLTTPKRVKATEIAMQTMEMEMEMATAIAIVTNSVLKH